MGDKGKNMRSFSKNEKAIIKKIISGYEENHKVNCLQNLLFSKNGIFRNGYSINFSDNNEVYFYIPNTKIDSENSQSPDGSTSNLNKKIDQEISEKLYEVLFLLEYLKENKYIVCLDMDIKRNDVQSDLPEIRLDYELSKLILQFKDKTFIVQTKLRDLVKQKFQELDAYEEHKRDMWFRILTTITIIVSIVSIIVNCCTVQNVKIQNTPLPIEINEKEEQSAQTETEPKVEEVPTVNVYVQEEKTQQSDEKQKMRQKNSLLITIAHRSQTRKLNLTQKNNL